MNYATSFPVFHSPKAFEQSRIFRFLVFLVAVMIVVFETPYLTRNLPPSLIAVPVALFFSVFFLSKPLYRRAPTDLFLSVVFFVSVELFYKFIGMSDADWGFYFATDKFFFLFLSMACIGPVLTQGQQKFLCGVSIFGMTVNMVDNVRIWLEMGSMKYVVYFVREGQKTNTADTAFATAVMLLMGAVYLFFLHGPQKWVKALALAYVAFCAYMLTFVMQRGITFFLGILLLFFLSAPGTIAHQQRSLKIFILLVLFAVMAMLIWGGWLEMILGGLSHLLEGERLQSRIDSILRLLQNGQIDDAGGSLTGRFHLAILSMNSFLQSPASFLFGVGDHRGTVGMVVGNHSQFFDMFARYGIIGGGCFVWILVQTKRTLYRIAQIPASHPLHAYLTIFFVFFFARTCLGITYVGAVATQLLVTIPLVVSLIGRAMGSQPDTLDCARNCKITQNRETEQC